MSSLAYLWGNMKAKKPKSPELLEVMYRFGTLSAVSSALGVSKAAVSVWHRVPLHHVRRVCELTGMRPEEVRPDVYGGWDQAA